MNVPPPPWLSDFADSAAACLHGYDLLAPVGSHFFHNQAIDQWELTLFVSATEIVGGERDGEVTHSKFSVDVLGMASLFNDVSKLDWQALTIDKSDALGAHFSIEGKYFGCNIWLKVLALPPQGTPPGRTLDIYQQKLEDIW
ncbi:hypothetical protein MNBD_PLANCTO02-387 [hydrothermal vent metagenome]|uniref:Uncharacterized protein n=1 Tax=hydrothermal vent metagenome TaxID=652676 RepID=A0A3B1D6P0_9ZZZZ